jgi:nucleoside-diphosphate-sugar epimerase
MFLNDCLNLTLNYLHVAALPSVKAGLTFSSGAATFDPLDNQFSPYSASKVLHERMVNQAAVPTLIMRCYAVTGAHCQEPRGYAVTDLIEQANQGKIKINSSNPTFRRYMAFEDYAATGIAELGKNAIVESGGYWTEIGQVAQIIARAFNVKVHRKKVTGKPQQYGSQDNLTHRIAQREGIKVKSIIEQIQELL